MNRSYCSGVLISISAETVDCSSSKGQDKTAIFASLNCEAFALKQASFKMIPGIRSMLQVFLRLPLPFLLSISHYLESSRLLVRSVLPDGQAPLRLSAH